MEIIIAESAGFCFGVNNAVNMTYNLVNKSKKPIFTLGPIIHNEQVVKNLDENGVVAIDEIDDLKGPGHIVIRAHGVVPEVYERINATKLEVSDATCPYVKKIHFLVKDKYNEGCQIIIVGDRNHPEVIGINGWCNNTAFIVDNIDDANLLVPTDKKVCVVAQTTITSEKWEKINEILEKKFENILKFDTICNATNKRQTEAAKIAKVVDLMIVIGSKKSSNTQKLYEISSTYCPNTHIIETFGDLPPVDIKKIKKLGITAGASTPDWIIKEVIEKMEELNKQENEMSFKEAFENSLVTLQSGEIVKGTIIGFNNAEVFVDMGFKSDGIIPMEEFTDDPDFDPEKDLKVGDEVEVFIIRVNDGEGNVQLSKKKVDAFKSWDKLEEAFENKAAIKVKVTEVTKGGVLATFSGIRIFIPASQIGDRYVKDLKEYLKKIINIRIIEIVKNKRKVVGSERIILKEERERLEKEFWGNIEVGKKYNGVVKSLTDFGAFVDIGGVDGLVHLSELSWTKVKHPSEVLKIGSNVEVTILEFDKEKRRISLGYRKAEDNPWFNAEEKYKVGEVVKGTVVRLVPFGAFVELEKGIDGLVHISQISNVRLSKPSDVLEIGQQVEAKVIEFNQEAKKVSLSIKEVNPIDPVNTKTEADGQSDEDNIPSEHVEDMSVKIADMVEDVSNEKETK